QRQPALLVPSSIFFQAPPGTPVISMAAVSSSAGVPQASSFTMPTNSVTPLLVAIPPQPLPKSLATHEVPGGTSMAKPNLSERKMFQLAAMATALTVTKMSATSALTMFFRMMILLVSEAASSSHHATWTEVGYAGNSSARERGCLELEARAADSRAGML